MILEKEVVCRCGRLVHLLVLEQREGKTDFWGQCPDCKAIINMIIEWEIG
jgi:hypothetical protein